MKLKNILCAAALFGGLGIAAVTAYAEETIKIGLIAPFSGAFADYGEQMEAGIKAYMKQHGDKVAGKRVEILFRDTTGPCRKLPSVLPRSWSCATK